ncbi:MAG: hypothetical protein A2126_01840 [Candidatus Woykebacteria bacterium GWB1_45_5]|uniref:Uncharacterized protein n=1 Tax=Candidatus Woykebacteria bacterium GWB1_45_5 TaxID=1802592 RepID=A0A1G1W626_9BACT|nr:MAG: hypothetical protein A2126_01840 [Candidatus Woykebacteria bacterium GWB1_45_5]
MKVVIDARFYGPEGAGLGKYVEKLLEYLEQLDKETEYFIFLRKENFHLYKPTAPNFKKVLADARWYSLKEQVLLPITLAKIKPDLTHFAHYNIPFFWAGKFIVTIYDLTKTEFGKQASNIKNPAVYLTKQTIYNLVLKRAIKNSLKIIAGSESTKNKLISWFKVDDKKIKTIYAGPDELFVDNEKTINTEEVKEVANRYHIQQPFVIYVGNAFPYKNLVIVLRALKLLDKKISFVYTSSRNVFVDKLAAQAKELGVGNRLITTGFVPNEHLAALYKLAACLVFPSLSEGFGLPGVEAMASRCPVVCSDIDVFKEVYNEAALYFDPNSASDLTNKINLVINGSDLRKDLINKGLEQAGKYSWRKLAIETLGLYKKVITEGVDK